MQRKTKNNSIRIPQKPVRDLANFLQHVLNTKQQLTAGIKIIEAIPYHDTNWIIFVRNIISTLEHTIRLSIKRRESYYRN